MRTYKKGNEYTYGGQDNVWKILKIENSKVHLYEPALNGETVMYTFEDFDRLLNSVGGFKPVGPIITTEVDFNHSRDITKDDMLTLIELAYDRGARDERIGSSSNYEELYVYWKTLLKK